MSAAKSAATPAFLRDDAKPTACIALADGQVFWGRGFGAAGQTVGELCFNTAMTGYQEVMTDPSYAWTWPDGYAPNPETRHKVVAVDFGAKHNILRCLTDAGCDVTVVPASTSADDILAMQPDGIFLTNGPGDPAATGEYAVPTIRSLIDADLPVFGVCLGHQLLAMALGGKTAKMKFGHHGANHPVKDVETGKVEITSMNHGFTVDEDSLPASVVQTHISLFDGSNCGLRDATRQLFSVQYHPEASPGPKDSFYLFERFAKNMDNISTKTK